LDQNMNQRN